MSSCCRVSEDLGKSTLAGASAAVARRFASTRLTIWCRRSEGESGHGDSAQAESLVGQLLEPRARTLRARASNGSSATWTGPPASDDSARRFAAYSCRPLSTQQPGDPGGRLLRQPGVAAAAAPTTVVVGARRRTPRRSARGARPRCSVCGSPPSSSASAVGTSLHAVASCRYRNDDLDDGACCPCRRLPTSTCSA